MAQRSAMKSLALVVAWLLVFVMFVTVVIAAAELVAYVLGVTCCGR